jgi:FkbM family methyltransferase
VVVAGAPRFDEFFALEPQVSREGFYTPLRLDPARPTLLYLCSSRFIAAHELEFIRRWLAALRSSGGTLDRCNVIVRPHPDVVLVDGGPEPEAVTWPAMRQATGWVQRPFDDPAALVLRTTYGTPQAFYECLHHARAVVALNTSAELEAGIAGRPVYTVLATEDAADGQANTIHFNYLLREHGGFVHYAPDLDAHVAQLTAALNAAPDTSSIRAFISAFLRPLGDRPVAPALARLLADRAAAPGPVTRPGVPSAVTRTTAAEAADWDEDAAEPGSTSGEASGGKDTLALGTAGATTRLYATAATKRVARHGVVRVPSVLEHWLGGDVAPGDVLYDIGAGVGVCSVLAARQRGVVVVAFEPGFAAFHELCDNVILNECGRTVIPLPVALAARTGLLSLTYPHAAGGERHALRTREWRPGREAPDDRYTQPVCAEPLDDIVRRHRLPPPHAVRIALRSGADEVLRGAASVLETHRPRTILVMLKDAADAGTVEAAAAQLGYASGAPVEPAGQGAALRLVPAGGAGPRSRPWGALRRVAGRARAGS